MALPKLYDRVYWDNNTTPAINEDNLNSLSKAVDDIDDRVISLAGTIMEDVPQIQEDLEILEPAIENIDSNVERAETAADDAEDSAETAEYWANVSNPPIPVVKDFANVISVDDAIPKAATDVKVKIEAVQDLHGYTKPWVGGAGKNLLRIYPNYSVEQNGITVTGIKDSAGNQIGLNVNGRATADCALTIFGKGIGDSFAPLAGKTLKIYGGANSNSNVYMQCASSNGFWGNDTTGSGSSAFTVESTEPSNWNAQLIVKNGTQLNNVKIYPMICLASASSDFEPYENICPINGFTEVDLPRTGKNIFKTTATTSSGQGVTWTVNDDGTITPSGTASGYAHISAGEALVKSSFGKVTVSGLSGATNIIYDLIRVMDKDNNELANFGNSVSTNVTIDLSNYPKAHKIFVELKRASNAAVGGIIKPQIELGDTATPYAPYTGTDYIIALDGTRYGGVLDVDAGTLTLTKKALDMGAQEYTSAGDNGYTLGVNDIKTVSSYSDSELICSALFNDYSLKTIMPHGSMRYDSTNSRYLYFKYMGLSSAAEFATAMTGQTLVYPLATPQTIQLTPTEVQMLQGYNVLSANSGDVYLEYDASMIQRIANEKLDISTFKSVVASSSDFADFKTRVAAL